MRLVLAAGLWLASSLGAAAQSFCAFAPLTPCEGCSNVLHAKVVVSSVPRPVVQGQPAHRPWCRIGFRSIGGTFRPPEILQPASLGTLQVRGPTLYIYKSDRIGRDRAVVRQYWNGRDGREQSAVITMEIEVVGAPM